MGATITDGTTTITPVLVLGYAASQTARNIFHDILDRPDPDVSLAPATLRSGTLRLLFDTTADAEAARAFHAQAARFIYVDADEPTASMVYALADSGTLDIELDPDTLSKCTLAVPFREVAS
jgi:hypothetical protein